MNFMLWLTYKLYDTLFCLDELATIYAQYNPLFSEKFSKITLGDVGYKLLNAYIL